MKRILLTILAVAMSVLAMSARDYVLSTPNNTLVLTAKTGEPLYFRYYGTKAELTDENTSVSSALVP